MKSLAKINVIQITAERKKLLNYTQGTSKPFISIIFVSLIFFYDFFWGNELYCRGKYMHFERFK